MADQIPPNPPPSFFGQSEEDKQRLLSYTKEREKILELANFKKGKAAEAIREIEKQRKLVEDQWKAGKIGVAQYHSAIGAANKAIIIAQKESAGVFTKTWQGVGSAISQLGQKMGIDIERAGIMGWTIWATGLFDTQRRLANWAGLTTELFGRTGQKGGKEFRDGMISYLPDTDTTRYVTDQMRLEFTQNLFKLGATIGKDASVYNTATIHLLKFGQAFGMSASEMAQGYFVFSDVLQKSEKGVTDYVDTLGKKALAWKLHPATITNMNMKLLDQYKLMKLSGTELTGILGKLVQVTGTATAGFGKMATYELAQKWTSSVASLDMGKMAALIKFINPTNATQGTKMYETMYKFYQTGKMDVGGKELDRAEIMMKSVKKIREEYTTKGLGEGVQKFQSMVFLKDFLGLGPEVATPIIDAIFKASDGTEDGQKNLANEIDTILKETTPIQDQFLNVVTNGLGMLVRGVWTIANIVQARFPKEAAAQEKTGQDIAYEKRQKEEFDLMLLSQELSSRGETEKARARMKSIEALKKLDEQYFDVKYGEAKRPAGAGTGGKTTGTGQEKITTEIKLKVTNNSNLPVDIRVDGSKSNLIFADSRDNKPTQYTGF